MRRIRTMAALADIFTPAQTKHVRPWRVNCWQPWRG